MNYRKSILSLAAIVALNSTVMADPAATYVPLTTSDKDRAWVMFGVNEFSDGTPSVAATTVSTFTTGYSTVTDTISDNLATSGFPDSGSVDMGSVQALDDSVTNFTANPIVAIKSTDLTFSQTEPERSMYISIVDSDGNGGGTAKIKLNYKASMEGREIEIQINGDTSTIYRTNVSQTATFNNPAPAANTVTINGTAPKLSKVDDVLAYDLSNAPVLASAYSKADHQFEKGLHAAEGQERFYHYDAANQKWLLWDRDKTGSVGNDFADFTKGQAYWGRIDMRDPFSIGTPFNDRSVAGVVLGKNITSSYADETVYTGKLTADSWNMISFDPAKNPAIRNAATGMILDLGSLIGAADGKQIAITDETGVNSIIITFGSSNNGDRQTIAKHINERIEVAKFLGELPSTFDVKAFATDSDDHTVFISDKKFTVKDLGSVILDATTLTGGIVVDTSTGKIATAAVTDVPITGVTSVYGEYAMLMEPLVGAGSASDLDSAVSGGGTNLSARVQFGTIDGDSKNGNASGTPVALAANDTTTTVTSTATTFTTDDVFNGTTSTGQVIQLDTDFDGTPNMVLAASRVPFYAKDNTYTRVYTFNNTGNATPITVKATANTAIAVANTDNVDNLITKINAQADAASLTGVYASKETTGKLVVVSSNQRTFGLLDADSATDNYLISAVPSEDIAQGAIKRVIDISKLAKKTLTTNKFTFTFTVDASGTDGGDGNNAIVVNGNAAVDTAIPAATNTDTLRIAMLDSFVTEANKVLKAQHIAAYASHNYVNGLNDITKAVITVEGHDLNLVTMTIDDTALSTSNTTTAENAGTTTSIETAIDANVATAGIMSLAGTTIVDNLRDNAVYTPDYVNYGPLYTLKNAGYEAKAIIRPSTDIGATTTHWDHIDLTRASSDWLKNNEFNLFSVDNAAGYWVYLTAYTDPNAIAISNPVYTPYYSYHFINDGGANDGTTENIIDGGQFSVEIDGVTEATSNVKAIVGGQEIELTREGGTGNTYSATITKFEADIAPGASPVTIGVRATDGVGESAEDLTVKTFDYTKPATPTVAFNNGVEAAFDDNSTDVATYYLYENFIPDNLASPVEAQLSEANASTYNICAKTSFAADPVANKHDYKLVAVDGTGVLGGANASDVTSFTYVNILSGATVLTHTAGDGASTITAYDTNCATTTANTGGIDITSLSGSVKMSFVSLGANISNETDLPWTVFYDLNGDGNADVKVSMIASYASKRIYIQSGTNVYTATLPADEATADASFTTAIDISTPITADNQTLAAQ